MMKKKFYWRSYVSFSLVLSFLVITISGIVLYLAPPGRVARWTAWVMMGFTRGQWEDLHTLFSYLFIIFGFFHLLMFNWKLFFSYIRSRVSKGLNRKRELILAAATFGIILVFTLAKLPPVYSVMDLGSRISSGWAVRNGYPPVPHAEEMLFYEFSRDIFETTASDVAAKAKELGLTVSDTLKYFDEIASENGISPARMFRDLEGHFKVAIKIEDRR